jgi:hypothetical protein
MADIGSALRIPRFLSAPSPQRLEQIMLENNLRKGKEHRYFDITYDGKRWFVWFYEEIKIKGQIK